MKDECTGSYTPCCSFGPQDYMYVRLTFTWVFKRFYRMLTKYFLRCSMIEFFTKSGLAEPNILVWSSFCKPKWYLQHPLYTELDLCLTKQKEANVWSAFNLIYNIFLTNYAGNMLSTRIITKEWKKLQMIVKFLEWFQRGKRRKWGFTVGFFEWITWKIV